MTDELSAPLSRKRDRSFWRKLAAGSVLRLPLARILFALVGLILVGAVLRVVLVNDPTGGRPTAEVAIDATKPVNPLATALTAEAPPADEPVTVTMGTEAGGGPTVTTFAETTATPLPPAQMPAEADSRGIFPDLAEETQYGPIPRVGSQGETPFTAYSRPSLTPAAAGGKPLVAIIVTGLGLNETGTLEAIDTLPDNVTLAFAPYGKTLEETAAAARAQGHELFLELPLEPFDYPDNDPGPETLLTGQPPRANLDKLFWLMARFGGYASVINHMGARFTSSAADFSPLMEELGTRGVGYLDDGSSHRSLAPQLAKGNKVPFARADLILDTNPARAPILSALEGLEVQARDKGFAIGVISALPISIRTVAEWAQGLDSKGMLLVPASALMQQ